MIAPKTIAIFGASGSIGSALTQLLATTYPSAQIHAISRSPENLPTQPNITHHSIDYSNENSIKYCAEAAAQDAPLDLVLVTTGILHEGDMMPEKSLKDLTADHMQRLFTVNTILPALIAKHAVPYLNKSAPSIFAALSARIGSISDNHLGGWHSYRASKSALNMIIKNAAIETARRNKNAIIIGLHPGTVDSHLSKPFQANIKNNQLFTPDYAAQKLLNVINTLTPDHTGQCLAWDGQPIPP